MKPVLLMYPSGASGDFLACLHLLYNHNIPIRKYPTNRWLPGSHTVLTDRIIPRKQSNDAQRTSVITRGHLIEELDIVLDKHGSDFYANHIRTHITVTEENIKRVAQLYTLKVPFNPKTGQGIPKDISYDDWLNIAIGDVRDQAIPIETFDSYDYAELFDTTSNTIFDLFESWGTVIPDQEALLMLIQYYNKCNDLILNGIKSNIFTIKKPKDIRPCVRFHSHNLYNR